MNRRQKLVQKQFLNNEKTVIKRLEFIYDASLSDINKKIRTLEFQIGDLTEEYDWMDDNDPKKEIVRSKIQSKIYQKQYQEQLQKQVDGILKEMQTKQFLTVSDYLDTCYEDSFIGSIFDLHGQGVPLMIPLDQTKMVRAIQLDSKISKGLYTKLGEDVGVLKKRITSEVTRSIATGSSYAQCAQRLAGQTKIGYNKAVRIARTEGHRIQTTAAMDVMESAKEKGADVLKQWDAALDDVTRESHRMVDGEIREVDEKFSNGLMFPGDPAGGAAEVVNCRCALLQRARWALDEDELQTLKDRAAYFGLDKSEQFDDFKKNYLKAVQDPEPVVVTVDRDPITLDMFPRSFRGTKAEAKNTQVVLDFINGSENADPDVVKLYSKMGKMENIESQGVPFKVKHTKNSAVNYQYRLSTGDLAEASISYPKLTLDNPIGQLNTTLHEQMHLMDMYSRTNPKKATGWCSSSQSDLKDFFRGIHGVDDVKMSPKVKKMFSDFANEYNSITSQISASKRKQLSELRDQYTAGSITYTDYKKQYNKIENLHDDRYSWETRNALGGGVDCLQDIYDALSGGKFRDKGVVMYGHGGKYYNNIDSRCEETLANYGALSITRPELIDLLREDYPELVDMMDKTVKEMLKKVGD